MMTTRDFRELHETRHLYAWVSERENAFSIAAKHVVLRVFDELVPNLPPYLGDLIQGTLIRAVWHERIIAPAPKPNLQAMTLKDLTEYRALLFEKQYAIRNTARTLDLIYQGLRGSLHNLCNELPATATPSPFTIPLMYALPNPRLTVTDIITSILTPANTERGLFRTLSECLRANISRASRRSSATHADVFVFPFDSKLPVNELVDAYLAGTPYYDLFMTPVPLKLTQHDRFNHMHIIGGSGAGKTTLIENLVLHDLSTPDPPSLVIVDPHGDLVQKLIHVDAGIEDRLLYINPRDIHHPVAINIFAMNQERMASYDEVTREQVSAGVIQTFDYLFSSLFDLDLTGKQQVFFRYVTRLMLSLPQTLGRNATILDMLALMKDAKPYQPAIEALPPIQRDFFEHDFNEKTFAQTKDQIRYRLQAIIENPTLARLFTSPETKLDFFTELNRGRVIVIDTAKDFLKDGSSIFGQICISLILQAIQERAALPEHERKPTFIYIDEAADFFSDDINDLLTEARKYKAGMVLSHQYLDQASQKLRSSLASNTLIKFAARLSAQDARAMASEMRTSADFITDQPRMHFAAHIRNVTPHAVSIPVGFVNWEPQLSPEAYEAFIERNRREVSLPRKPDVRGMPVSPPPDEDISKEW